MIDFRRGPPIWFLVTAATLLWGGEYLLRGLWEPDEARYAYVAREMQENAHWFVPHLHGEPYPDKPPLPFWLTNLAALAFGGSINGVSARLPTFLGALLVLWSTARLLEQWCGPPAAWRVVGVLFTCYLFWHEGGWGRIDMLLLGLEMMALYLLLSYNRSQHWTEALAAYLFIGLAILAKGPIALVVPLGIYAAITWAEDNGVLLKRWHWLWGIPVALTFPAVWLFIAWREGAPSEYFEAMFGAKSFGRVIRDHHAQPFYYYLKTFPLDFLPWTLFLPSAVSALGKGILRRRLLAWFLFVVVLFSLFVGKRNVYLLAAFPAAAMIIAAGWDLIPTLPRRWATIPSSIAIGLLVVVGLTLTGAIFVPEVPIDAWRLFLPALIAVAGTAAAAWTYRREGMGDRYLYTYIGTFFILWITVSTLVLPALNPIKAPIELTAEARQQMAIDQPLYLYREQLALIPFYAERPGRYLREPEEVAKIIDSASSSDHIVIVFTKEDWEGLSSDFAHRVHARPFRLGSKRLVWVNVLPPTR